MHGQERAARWPSWSAGGNVATAKEIGSGAGAGASSFRRRSVPASARPAPDRARRRPLGLDHRNAKMLAAQLVHSTASTNSMNASTNLFLTMFLSQI